MDVFGLPKSSLRGIELPAYLDGIIENTQLDSLQPTLMSVLVELVLALAVAVTVAVACAVIPSKMCRVYYTMSASSSSSGSSKKAPMAGSAGTSRTSSGDAKTPPASRESSSMVQPTTATTTSRAPAATAANASVTTAEKQSVSHFPSTATPKAPGTDTSATSKGPMPKTVEDLLEDAIDEHVRSESLLNDTLDDVVRTESMIAADDPLLSLPHDDDGLVAHSTPPKKATTSAKGAESHNKQQDPSDRQREKMLEALRGYSDTRAQPTTSSSASKTQATANAQRVETSAQDARAPPATATTAAKEGPSTSTSRQNSVPGRQKTTDELLDETIDRMITDEDLLDDAMFDMRTESEQ